MAGEKGREGARESVCLSRGKRQGEFLQGPPSAGKYPEGSAAETGYFFRGLFPRLLCKEQRDGGCAQWVEERRRERGQGNRGAGRTLR